MLLDLQITNGVISPKYDIYNDIYTVSVLDDVTSLDIIYDLTSDNVLVEITNNHDLNLNDKVVNLKVSDGVTTRNIYLNVIHENAELTTGLQEYFDALEIRKKEETSMYVAPLIGASCFLILLIVFSILFHKKKKL